MFDLKRPCSNCPFRKDTGRNFALGADRLDEIMASSAFQCHKTVDYDHFDDPEKRSGDRPQQCAGLMALLDAEDQPNQIMQVASRLGCLDTSQLNHSEAYASFADAYAAHCAGLPPQRRN
jgi:hypothetical protein